MRSLGAVLMYVRGGAIQVLEGHLEAVLALAVGNGHLISGSYDTTVCLHRHFVALPTTMLTPALVMVSLPEA